MSGSVSRREQIQQKQVAVAAVAWSIFGLYIGPLYSRSLPFALFVQGSPY